MDNIEFKLSTFKFGINDDLSHVVQIYINGKNLIEIIKSDPNHPENGICLTENTPQSLYLNLVAAALHEENAQIYICSCGSDCESFEVNIDVGPRVVVWYEWKNGTLGYEETKYVNLRPYVFDRVQYMKELDKLCYWYYKNYWYCNPDVEKVKNE